MSGYGTCIDPREEYDKLAGSYDRRWAGYVAASTRKTLQRLSVGPGARILDVGCGTGELLKAVRQQHRDVFIAGVDLSQEMLRVAAQKFGAAGSVVHADAHHLPFADAAFDIVTSVSAFHYLHGPARVLVEARRVLKPQGRIVITDWCGDFLGCRFLAWLLPVLGKAHERTFRVRELVDAVTAAGYADIAVDKYRIDLFWGLMTVVATAPASRDTTSEQDVDRGAAQAGS